MPQAIARPPAVWSLTRIIPPAREMVSIEEARAQCRVPEYEDAADNQVIDQQLARYISAAREYLEAATGRTFYETRWRAVLSADSDYIVLPRATPLKQIIAVSWRPDAWSNWLELAAGGDYVADIAPECGGVALRRTGGEVEVVYDAGLDDSADPPAVARQAALLLIGHYWENREAEAITDRAAITAPMLRYGLDALIQALRVI